MSPHADSVSGASSSEGRPAIPRLVVVTDFASLGIPSRWIETVEWLGEAVARRPEVALEFRLPKDETEAWRRERFLEAFRALTELEAGAIPRLVANAFPKEWDEIGALAREVLGSAVELGFHAPESGLAELAEGPTAEEAERASAAAPAEKAAGTAFHASVHDLPAARRAFAEGARAVRYGPVFAPGTKPVPGVGLERLEAFVREAGGPVIAVGGITPENAPDVWAAGVHGLAVVGAVLHAEEPGEIIDVLLRR